MSLVKISEEELADLRMKAEAHDKFRATVERLGLRRWTVEQQKQEQQAYWDTAPAWARNGIRGYCEAVGWLAAWDELMLAIAQPAIAARRERQSDKRL